jgi:pseudo-rSAM protein
MLKEIENIPININIIGGNIFEYSNYQELIAALNQSWHNVFYYFHYSDFTHPESIDKLSAIREKTIKVLLIDFPFVQNEFVKWEEVIKQHIQKVECIVENDEQIAEAEQIISQFEITDYMFRPYYNGLNIDFFKGNVFLNEEDILEVKESLFELATKKISNPAFFGKLIFNADGNIFTSFNFPSIGNINNFNIRHLIFNLLEDENSSWRVNKTVVTPCKDCIFNLLCSPISNYELVIRQNNLCHV